MSKKKPQAIPSGPVQPDKWAALREAARIKLADYRAIPHCNSTTTGLYQGNELRHRGSAPCSSNP